MSSRFTRVVVSSLVGGLWLATAQPAHAQDALTLDELIVAAPTIVVATVTGRRADWESYGASRLIITTVTLEVEQSLKGGAPRTLVVEVMGGSISDETQRLSHVPEFRVRERDVLFLNGLPHAVSPLVGSDQGRFRVLEESAGGTARVVTVGFHPLRSLAEIGAARTAPARSLSEALSLSDFVTRVRDRIRELVRP
jgi:hypothetical protein